jgi:hypothetical protein
MSESKHTPGPWELGEWIRCTPHSPKEGTAVYRQIKSRGRQLASVSVFGYRPNGEAGGRKYKDRFGTERVARLVPEAEADANARLIAAAPDLLRTAEAYIRALDNPNASVMEAAHAETDLRDAIARAKGEGQAEEGDPPICGKQIYSDGDPIDEHCNRDAGHSGPCRFSMF